MQARSLKLICYWIFWSLCAWAAVVLPDTLPSAGLSSVLNGPHPHAMSIPAGVYALLIQPLPLTWAAYPKWVVCALPLGAALAVWRRLRWRSLAWSTWLAWMPFGLLAAFCLVFSAPLPPVLVVGVSIGLALARRIRISAWTLVVAGGTVTVAIVLVCWFWGRLLPASLSMALSPLSHGFYFVAGEPYTGVPLFFLVGSTLGGLLAMPVVALFRAISGDIGYYSWPLSFTWRRGTVAVRVRYHTRWLIRRSKTVPLSTLRMIFEQERLHRWGYTGGLQYITLYGHSGGSANAWVNVPGKAYEYEVATGWYKVDFAGTEIKNATVYLREWSYIEASRAMKRLEVAIDQRKKQEQILVDAEERTRLASAKADASFAMVQLIRDAQLSDDCWYYYRWRTAAPRAGGLIEAIAADRDGRGVALYDDGSSRWVGSWIGATVRETDEGLLLQVDDPDYRKEHISDRFLKLGKSWEADVRRDWASRIQNLSRLQS